MDLRDYQIAQQRTWNVDWPLEDQIENAMLGLTGELGEIAELRKKAKYHGRTLLPAEMRKEIGDLLHYVSALASLYGFSLEEVAQENIDKLWTRYPNGFSVQDSIRRADCE